MPAYDSFARRAQAAPLLRRFGSLREPLKGGVREGGGFSRRLGSGYRKSDAAASLFLVPSDVLFSNSMLEDMEKIWALRDIIPDPNCYGQKTEGIE